MNESQFTRSESNMWWSAAAAQPGRDRRAPRWQQPMQQPMRAMARGQVGSATASRTSQAANRRPTEAEQNWAGECLFEYYNG